MECFISVIDQIVTSLSERVAAYEQVENNFGFLKNLRNLADSEIKKHSEKLLTIYETDLKDYLVEERTSTI